MHVLEEKKSTAAIETELIIFYSFYIQKKFKREK